MFRILPFPLLTATPALAAGDVFFSLWNTDFVVLIAFLLFVAAVIYFKVPPLIGGMLDKRAENIRNELDEARSLRDEAQELLDSYERKKREVDEQSRRIVASARAEAEHASMRSKEEIERSKKRRIAAGREQIASAEANAVKEIRDRAIEVATAAASEVISARMAAADRDKLTDDSIETVESRLR